MTLPTQDQALRWIGLPVVDASGAALGSCRNVYADDASGVPEWVEVQLSGADVAFVPTLDAVVSGGSLSVAHALDVVDRAPRFAGDAELSPEAERALYEHYGVPYSSERSSSLLPTAADGPPAASLLPAPAPEAASAGRSRAPLVAGAGVAALAAAALLARRRRQRRPEVTPEQRGTGALAALLLAVGGLLALRRRRRRDDDVEIGPVVRLPGVVDHSGLVGDPVDPAAVDPAVADPERAPY